MFYLKYKCPDESSATLITINCLLKYQKNIKQDLFYNLNNKYKTFYNLIVT